MRVNGTNMRAVRHFVALILLAAVAAGMPAHAQDASLVFVDKIRTEPLSQTVPVIGRLVALQSGEVASRIGGAVTEFHVEVGDVVDKGQVLAELDTALLEVELAIAQGELRQAEAELMSNQAQLKLNEQELARFAGLEGSQAFSKARFEDAQQNVERAKAVIQGTEATIATRRASVQLRRLNLEYARIRAPYRGVVIRRMVEAGAYVTLGTPVVRMMADLNLEVEADVPANRLASLTPGTPVGIVLDDGSEHRAVVRAILPTENPLTRTRTVRLTPEFAGGMAGMADAQSVTVKVPVGVARNVLTVHKDAIITRGGKKVVYVVRGDSAEMRPVVLGEATGGRIEVLEGLKDGEEVVIRGNERLQPGAKVRVETGS